MDGARNLLGCPAGSLFVRGPQSLRRSFAELRVPGFVFGVAELLQVAAIAFGFAGYADPAAVVD